MSSPAFSGSLSAYVVEPSAMQGKIIVGELEALGIRATKHFTTASEALAAMKQARPDVVVSALYLPDMSGTELIATMRQDRDLEQVAFLLVSSETRPQALEPVRQSGVCGILPKPFTREQLQAALATTMDYLSHDSNFAATLDAEGLKVLLVDDSPSARKFMRRVLENLGINNFIECENGREAVSAMAETMIDLVVTDYNMPEMDGQALVNYIRQQSWQNSVPILMVTSESNEGRLAAIEESGVSGICDKPFEPTIVKRLLSQLLADRN